MPALLKLESLGSNPPVEIATIQSGSITFGREPENGIVIDSTAVSRRHGAITEAGSQWVYRDFASTNGSWVNGIQLMSGQIRVLRSGDLVKIADFPMRVIELGSPPGFSSWSLLVFLGDKFEQEFVFTPERVRFSLGGPGSDVIIAGEATVGVQFMITKHGRSFELTTGKSNYPVIVNGLASTGTTTLADRDEISCGSYRVVVNDRTDVKRASAVVEHATAANSGIQAYEQRQVPDHLRRPYEDGDGWKSEAAKRRASSGRKFIFNGADGGNNIESTMDMDPDEFAAQAGFEMHSSQRFFSVLRKPEGGSAPTNERTLVIVGMVTFVAILAFVAYVLLRG